MFMGDESTRAILQLSFTQMYMYRIQSQLLAHLVYQVFLPARTGYLYMLWVIFSLHKMYGGQFGLTLILICTDGLTCIIKLVCVTRSYVQTCMYLPYRNEFLYQIPRDAMHYGLWEINDTVFLYRGSYQA